MKAKVIRSVLFAVAVVALSGGLLSCSRKPPVAGNVRLEHYNAAFGVWSRTNGSSQKLVMHASGDYELFAKDGDSFPSEAGAFDLIDRVADQEGNMIYRITFTTKGESPKIKQSLWRISADKSQLEVVDNYVTSPLDRGWPASIDKNNASYCRYGRGGGTY